MPINVSWPGCTCGNYTITAVGVPPGGYSGGGTQSTIAATDYYSYNFSFTYTHATDPANNAPVSETASGTTGDVINFGSPYASLSIAAPYTYNSEKWTSSSSVNFSGSGGGTGCGGGSQSGISLISNPTGSASISGSSIINLTESSSPYTLRITGYNNCGGSVTRTASIYVDTTTPTGVISPQNIQLPYTDEWLGINKLSSFTGSVLFTDSQNNIIESYIEYTPSSTPNPTYSPITRTSQYNVILSNTPANFSNIQSLANGSDYYLHTGVRDIVQHASSIDTFTFKIDNDAPIFSNVTFNAGMTSISGNTFAITGEVWDNTSGVIYFEVNHQSTPTFDSSFLLTDQYTPTNTFVYDRNTIIPISSGSHTIYIHAIDQANNITTINHSYVHSGCNITWNSFTANRSSISPFLVEGNFEAEISGCGEKIKGFYSTELVAYTPQDPDFDTTNGEKIIYDTSITAFKMLVMQNNNDRGIIHLWITDDSYASNLFYYIPLDYTSLTYNPPTLSVKEFQDRTFTNDLSNFYSVDISGSPVSGANGTDLIIGFKITENPTIDLSEMPIFDSISGKYSGVNSDWIIFPTGIDSVQQNINYTFSSSSFGTKNIYVLVATIAYSGDIIPSQKQIFISSAFQIEYINDFEGPRAINVKIDGVSTTVSDTVPNQTHQHPTEVSSQNITISGELTDATGVERYVLNNNANAPVLSSSTWNVISGIQTSLTFSQAVTLLPLNSMKTVYLHAIDVVGNTSTNKIKVKLNSPQYQVPTYGLSTGSPFKLEGNPNDFVERNTIVSMFGGGVNHVGFISKDLNDRVVNGITYKGISSLRNHNLKNYRGLRVIHYDTSTNETLPTDDLKFTDFIGKIPRISDLKVVPYTSSPTSASPPSIENDVRNLVLTMDIDTGAATPFINNDVIDIYATWYISFLPENGGGLVTLNLGTDYTVIDGKVSSFNFSNAGTYLIQVFSSFGLSAAVSYRIYQSGALIPPTQGPPISVNVPIGSTGTTLVTIPFDVNQLSLGCDAVFVVDGSGSYNPGFVGVMSANAPALFDKIDEFSKDADTGNSSSRFAMVSFGGGVEADVSFPNSPSQTNRNTVQSALANPNKTGGLEPKIEATARTAEGIMGQWRDNVVRLCMLFSDEKDSGRGSAGGHCSPQIYWDSTSPTYYVKLLVENEIGFVVFDAGAFGAASADDLVYATQQTVKYGGIMSQMTLSATGQDMVTALDGSFQAYKQNLKFGLESDITSPAIIQSVSANSTQHPSSPYPIPYNNLVPVGAKRVAYFDTLLDNDEINNMGVSSIITYVTIYNSSDVPIARKMLIINLIP